LLRRSTAVASIGAKATSNYLAGHPDASSLIFRQFALCSTLLSRICATCTSVALTCGSPQLSVLVLAAVSLGTRGGCVLRPRRRCRLLRTRSMRFRGPSWMPCVPATMKVGGREGGRGWGVGGSHRCCYERAWQRRLHTATFNTRCPRSRRAGWLAAALLPSRARSAGLALVSTRGEPFATVGSAPAPSSPTCPSGTQRAFNLELAGVRDAARGNAHAGHVRMDFWRGVVEA
jgi:hypothetical protein